MYAGDKSAGEEVDRIVFRVDNDEGREEITAQATNLSLSLSPRLEMVQAALIRALIWDSRASELERVLWKTSSIRWTILCSPLPS
jgi:hypothetical protein